MKSNDPLKIYYVVVLAADSPDDTTAFQGFSKSWRHVHWSLLALINLPADVMERSLPLTDMIAQRMGDARGLAWLPLNVDALEQITAAEFGPFTVCFSGEEETGHRVADWANSQSNPILHVSNQGVRGACPVDDFGIERLRLHCLNVLKARSSLFSSKYLEAARQGLANWKEPTLVPIGLRKLGHNVVLPNHMSLLRSARALEEGSSFVGKNEGEYSSAILDSANAVFHIREEVGLRPLHRLSLLSPGVFLAEPALFRQAYRRLKPEGPFEERVVAKTLRMLQAQKGLSNEVDEKYVEDLRRSKMAQMLLAERQSELETYTLGVGLKAAQTCSAVVRLSPAVNHVFPALSAYARNVRAQNVEARLKTRRLFDKIQRELLLAVGEERVAFIEKRGGPIKIVSDAPIEWLPIGNLPLSLRYDCSRINATPGNLMMALLTGPTPITLPPTALQDVLVLSSFMANDPLRNILTTSINAIRFDWEGKVKVSFQFVQNEADFVEALNRFDGAILIFDGHGADNSSEAIGKLVLGGQAVDVWQMRGKVRVPPIVILSACDTQGIDASSHATVGNGFLALGARTVLATLLPVNGVASGSFVARLIYRIAEFLPAALNANIRCLNWTEVISGMIRMLLASEILDGLVGPPSPLNSPRGQIQVATNMAINTHDTEWFDKLLRSIWEYRKEPEDRIRERANGIVARSEAIRYVQLGNPETILIDDGRIQAAVMSEYSGALQIEDA